MKPWCLCLSVILFQLVHLLPAEETADTSLLSLDRIFNSDEFNPDSFGPARWLQSGEGYTTLENSSSPAGGKDIVQYDPATGTHEVLVSAMLLVPPGESTPLRLDDYQWTQDGSLLLIYTNSKRVWRRNTRGDYWVLDLTSRELRKLGGDARPSSLSFAKFSPTGRSVGYVRESNIYVEDLRGQGITQLTRDASDTIINGTFDWVYEEEFGLRDGFRFSPDGESIAYWQINTEGVREFFLINNTDSLYPRITPIKYPKTGETNPAARVGVVSTGGGRTRWFDVPGDPRNHYIARMDWAATSHEIILQQLNRLQNTSRVMIGVASTGKMRTVFTDTDSAWVNVFDHLRWLEDGTQFTWASERDGWRHLYLVSRSGGDLTLITPGKFDVISLEAVDEESGWLYYIASPGNPTRRYLYRARLDGTLAERVTPPDQPGTHSYQISPDSKWAFHTVSSFNRPPRTQLVSLPDHRKTRVLVDNSKLRKAVNKLKRKRVEFFRVKVEKGVLLDGWMMKPPDFDPGKRYPLLIFVYGEPAGQTVLDRWGGKRYLWHLLLNQRGYLVMSIDNRGTPAPRGRKWRKIIYRQVGILASANQAAATRAVIQERPHVDPSRIGIWGWSGGGSMSLNAIFRYPDLYHTAMSIAPISNQRFYDTIYQERYMGLPEDNVDGYRDGSPITYAHQLEGNLLLVHGTGDDNCHYQSTEALVNELIKSNKQFALMSYPNRSHSIREGINTTRHLYTLLTRYLMKNLPAGPR